MRINQSGMNQLFFYWIASDVDLSHASWLESIQRSKFEIGQAEVSVRNSIPPRESIGRLCSAFFWARLPACLASSMRFWCMVRKIWWVHFGPISIPAAPACFLWEHLELPTSSWALSSRARRASKRLTLLPKLPFEHLRPAASLPSARLVFDTSKKAPKLLSGSPDATEPVQSQLVWSLFGCVYSWSAQMSSDPRVPVSG